MTDGLSRKERTPCVRLFQSHRAYLTLSEGFSFPRVPFLHNTALGGKYQEGRGASSPVLWWAQDMGVLICLEGDETSSSAFPIVPCVINFHSQVENPGNVVGILWLVLDLFFHVYVYFHVLFAWTRHRIWVQSWVWCLSQSWGILIGVCHEDLHMCVWCFSKAMNQQFNYALFRKFYHHIALGKVFCLLYLCISKNALTLKWFLPNIFFQSNSPFSLFLSKWKYPSSLFGCIPLRAIEAGHMEVTLKLVSVVWFSVGLESADLFFNCSCLKYLWCLEKKNNLKSGIFTQQTHSYNLERGRERGCVPVLAATTVSYFAFLLHSPTIFIFWSRLRRLWALLELLLLCLPFPFPHGKEIY